MAPSAPSQPQQHSRPDRIPRSVHLIPRAYSAAEIATSCCPYHGVRLMTKARWLVRQLPLERYRLWKRCPLGLSTAEKIELVMFARLWAFLLVEVEEAIEDEGPLREAYKEVMNELDRSV